ncbi:MAG TPA: hypothetical protein DEH27_00755 [Deltaproteobacteria bacterium]|nr:hypothetical protein [Deltaproteobacteria bacterium]
MSLRQKLRDEIRAVALATLYFATWIGLLVLLKTLILAEYRIEFHGLSAALVGALVLAKVVLVLEHVPLGKWVRTRPALIEVALRTALYAFGVFVVLLLEKAFEGRREHGGFGSSLMAVFRHAEDHHVWANTICLSSALLGYNALSVVRRHLGEGELIRLFLSPLPEEKGPKHSGSPAPSKQRR